MLSKPIYAIAWKELRQPLWIIIGFAAIPFLFDTYLFWYQNRYQPFTVRETIEGFAVIYACIISIALAFLFGAGNRVIEASQGLRTYLRVCPLPDSTVMATYYGTGIAVWILWLLINLLSGLYRTILFGYSGLFTQPWKFYILFGIIFLVIYTITFFSAYLRPTLAFTATIFWTALIVTTIAGCDYRSLNDLIAPIVRLYPILIPGTILGILYAVYTYKKGQWDWNTVFSR